MDPRRDAGVVHTIIDPATEQSIAEVPSSTPEQVEDAVSAALTAQRAWREVTPSERASIMLSLAARIEENENELAMIDQDNVGKPWHVAIEEPRGAVDQLRFFAGAARMLEGRAASEYARGTTSFLRRDPLGVVACIAPWNYPLSTAVAKIAPAIAAGNSVVLKPSELTPLSALRLAELIADLVPEGLINVVTGDGPTVGAALSTHRDVAMISMTGSSASGAAIAAAAAPTLKRVHLELGGNAPVVVFDDADLDLLVTTLRSAAFWNSGQECGAASRILVQRGSLERLLEALIPMVESIKVGDPRATDTEIGPLTSAAQRSKVLGLLGGAVDGGARILTGGGTGKHGTGFYVEPTVIVDLDQHSDIIQTEVFGPVLTVQTFEDEAEALRLANDVPQALSGSVWTRDVARALRFTREMTMGTAWVNNHLVYFTEMPWGGMGATGGGRDNSLYALDDHTQTRHVLINLEG